MCTASSRKNLRIHLAVHSIMPAQGVAPTSENICSHVWWYSLGCRGIGRERTGDRCVVLVATRGFLARTDYPVEPRYTCHGCKKSWTDVQQRPTWSPQSDWCKTRRTSGSSETISFPSLSPDKFFCSVGHKKLRAHENAFAYLARVSSTTSV